MVQELEPSDAVVVPPGVERTLNNTGSTPLTVLVALSPKPSFANQSSPRRNAPRRELEVQGEEEAVEENETEQAGFDESRSGPSIGRPKRAVEPIMNDDRARGPARGGFGALRRDTFNNHPSRRDDDVPQDSIAAPEGRPFNRDDRPARPPFNRDDRPRGPRPAYGAPRGQRPFRPRPQGAGERPAYNRDDRPAFNRDDRPARPPFNRDERPARPPFNRDDRPSGPRPATVPGCRPFRPRNNEGVDRPAFNRDDRPARPPFNNDGPRPPRAPYGASRNARPFTPRGEGSGEVAEAVQPRRPPASAATRLWRQPQRTPRRRATLPRRPGRWHATRRRPGTVAGSTAPTGRVRDPGPDAESRLRRLGPPRGDARPAGNRAGPARPRRGRLTAAKGPPVGQRGRGPRVIPARREHRVRIQSMEPPAGAPRRAKRWCWFWSYDTSDRAPGTRPKRAQDFKASLTSRVTGESFGRPSSTQRSMWRSISMMPTASRLERTAIICVSTSSHSRPESSMRWMPCTWPSIRRNRVVMPLSASSVRHLSHSSRGVSETYFSASLPMLDIPHTGM